MNSQRILREIQSIKRNLHQLSKEVEAIRAFVLETSYPVERMLKARGIQVYRGNPTKGLFFPRDLSFLAKTRFYKLMKKYSFRLVVRDMIKCYDRFTAQDLTHYVSQEVARRYCMRLSQMGVIMKKGRNDFRTVVSPLQSFGPTLEWFIAEMFKREFDSPALYGVHVKGTTAGGDYDVVASWNRRLVYVEAKSSPPRGVELSEVTAFFSRIEDLIPDVAILFNDTQLRMKDKLVLLFEEELERRYGKKRSPLYRIARLVEELFHVGHRIFIINSKKDVVENFSLCLNDHLRQGEPRHKEQSAGRPL